MARLRALTIDRLWVLPSLAIPLIISATAWTMHVSSEGEEVAPNVWYTGVEASLMTSEEAADTVRRREVDFLETPVIIDIGERRLIVTADEVGFEYDYQATLADLMAARHGDGAWSEFVVWVSTPLSPVTVPDHYTFDGDTARERLSQDDFVIQAPVEPRLATEVWHTDVVPGSDGVGVDVEGVIADLSEADIASGTVEILAEQITTHPTMTNSDAEAEASAVNLDTEPGFLAVLDGTTVEFAGGQLRRNLVSSVNDGEMSLSIDLEGFQEEVEKMFPAPTGELVPPVMEVVDAEITVVSEGKAAEVCCTRESVARMAGELMNDPHTFYRLEPRPEDDETVLAWADGSQIIEPVAEFTTRHVCCQNRVTNIHVIADEVSGSYLLPGQTLSLNEFVGPRTLEKGYLVDGAIRGGYHVNEIGGGVSQFATTLFNAAFYGGLDLDEYRSHTVYFSRYPYGREATLSNPNPDLVITNATDYPVLIWPTYDDTSITVTLYSTKNVEVEELEQRISRRGGCRHSEIDRQRTFSDGSVLIDTIVADYRPGDGLNCSGNPIPRRN